MADRSKDWFAQARRDLEHARASQVQGRHEWACIAAHQSAENSVKALHVQLGQEASGHGIARLLIDLPMEPVEDLVEKAKVLDSYYLATRDASTHREGPPYEHYGKLQSEEAIRYAGEIVEFVRAYLA